VTAFPTTYKSRSSTLPLPIGALEDWGLSGKGQVRDTGAWGHTWSEDYGPLLARAHNSGDAAKAQAVQGWLATLESYLGRGTIFTKAHPQQRELYGAGGGTPLVNGASQTGASLITDGWPNTTTVLKAGDVINVAGLNPVFRVTAEVASNGSGQATIPLDPPIPAGSSPADNAAITTNATPGSVQYRAKLVAIDRPQIGVQEYISVTLAFREMP
jgi:hypothetical protein